MHLVANIAKHRASSLVSGAVSLGVALFIGETFYRFGSFTREVLVFLPTWAALYWGANKVASLAERKPKKS